MRYEAPRAAVRLTREQYMCRAMEHEKRSSETLGAPRWPSTGRFKTSQELQ